jgi:hypothetical protein
LFESGETCHGRGPVADLPGLAATERAMPLPGALVAVVAARKAGAPPPVPGAADIAEARCLDTRRSR